MKEDRYLTVKAACHMYSVSPRLLYREMTSGRLRSQKIGKLRRIRECDLRLWAEQQGPKSPKREEQSQFGRFEKYI